MYLQTGFIFIVIRLVAISIALWQLRHHPTGRRSVLVWLLFLKCSVTAQVVLPFQQSVDGDLQRPGLEEQQRAEGVEQRLQRLRQVAAVLGTEARTQAVLGQLLHRNECQSRTKRLQHGQREHRFVRLREGICR